jgi:RNA polymerase sigma-70 factor (ECF subfamily)
MHGSSKPTVPLCSRSPIGCSATSQGPRTPFRKALKAFSSQQESRLLVLEERILNGEPAVVAFQDGRAQATILISAVDHKVRHVFVQIDPDRLRHLGPSN